MNSNIETLQTVIKQKKIFIFDFDGVLVDSLNIKTDAFAKLYELYGQDTVNYVVDFHQKNGGMSRYDKFRHFHEFLFKEKITDELIDKLDKEFSKLVVEGVINAAEIKGAEKFTSNIAKNRLVAVCSATPTAELKQIISARNWEQYFTYIHGSPESKTNNLLKILKESNCNTTDAIFFGDAYADYIAASETNIDFIGVGHLWDSVKDELVMIGRIFDFSVLNEILDK